MGHKHVPLRTCIACRQVRAKRDMVRVVTPPEGGLIIDEKGKAAGRGAYLCRSRRCWALGLRERRLEHALRTPLSEQDQELLRVYCEQLPDDQPEG